MHKFITLLQLLLGLLLIAAGLFGIIGYIASVIPVLTNSDRSIIFWYLPLVIFGIPLVIAGLATTRSSIRRLKSEKPS